MADVKTAPSTDTKPSSPTSKDPEKSSTIQTFETSIGYIQEYAPAGDGIELNPKPTSDPLDPLNFPRFQKWTCMAIVMMMYFLFTYITTTTVPSFPLLQEQYSLTFAEVNWTVAIPALGLAVGPLFWSSLSDIIGRRIVFIIGTVIALAATIGAALAPSYGGYMAARFFQGFGVSPGSTVGMAIVNDMYFEHVRGAKLGLWVLAIDMGLLVGPLIGGFLTLVDQIWVQWFTAILFGVLLVAELFFLPETLYPRSKILSSLPTTDSGDLKKTTARPSISVDLKRTKQLPFLNFTTIPGIHAPKIYSSLVEFFSLIAYPNVSITVFVYCFCWYWWVLGVITYLPVAYATYTPQIQGLLFMGLILGTLVSELLCSGSLSDSIMLHFARKNNNIRVPENRLWLFYPAVIMTSMGLILWGVSIDKGYHWMVGQVAFFLFAAGIQIGNTVTSSYVVDCYPKQGMSVVIFYAVLLNGSAFVNPFLIAPWCDNVGFAWTFATQGMVTFFVVVPVTVAMQKWGGRLREWKGAPGWVSPEYAG